MVQFGVPLIIERGDRDAEVAKAAAVVRPRYAAAPRYIYELPDGLTPPNSSAYVLRPVGGYASSGSRLSMVQYSWSARPAS
jgi:hypothetical protein